MSLIERMIARRADRLPAESISYAREALAAAMATCKDAEEWVAGPWRPEYLPLTAAQRAAIADIRAAAQAARVALDGFEDPGDKPARWRRLWRLWFHRHDPIECGYCDLTPADVPPAANGDAR